MRAVKNKSLDAENEIVPLTVSSSIEPIGSASVEFKSTIFNWGSTFSLVIYGPLLSGLSIFLRGESFFG